jgi:hypothetical protein
LPFGQIPLLAVNVSGAVAQPAEALLTGLPPPSDTFRVQVAAPPLLFGVNVALIG